MKSKKNKKIYYLYFLFCTTGVITTLPLISSKCEKPTSQDQPKQPSVPNTPDPQPNPNPTTPTTNHFDISTLKVGDRLANGDLVVNLLSHDPDYFGRYFQHNPEELIIKDNNGVFKIAILNLQSGEVIKTYQVGDIIKNIGTKDYTLLDVDENTGKFYDKVVGKEIIFKDNALGGLKWIGHFNIEYAIESAIKNNKKYAYQEGDVELQRDVFIKEINEHGYELENHYTEADWIVKGKKEYKSVVLEKIKDSKNNQSNINYYKNYYNNNSIINYLKRSYKINSLFINLSNSADLLTSPDQIDAFVKDVYNNNKSNETLINFVKQELITEYSKYNVKFKTTLSKDWVNDNLIKEQDFKTILITLIEKDLIMYSFAFNETDTFKEALVASLYLFKYISENPSFFIDGLESYLETLPYSEFPYKYDRYPYYKASPTLEDDIKKFNVKVYNHLINNEWKPYVDLIKSLNSQYDVDLSKYIEREMYEF